MTYEDIIKLILVTNLDLLKSKEKLTDKDKIEIKFCQEAIDFFMLEQEFIKFSKMDGNDLLSKKEDYLKLAKKLNVLKENLAFLFNKICPSAFLNKSAPKEVIAKYAKDKFLDELMTDKKLLEKISNFFPESYICADIPLEFKELYKEISYTFLFTEKFENELKSFKYYIEAYLLLVNVYNVYGMEAVDKIAKINDAVIKNGERYIYPTDLFEIIFYKNSFKDKMIRGKNAKEYFLLDELIDKNSQFNVLNDNEIGKILVAFYKNKNMDKIVSLKNEHGFKDLSLFLNAVLRKSLDGYQKKLDNFINNVAEGKLSYHFEEKVSDIAKKKKLD